MRRRAREFAHTHFSWLSLSIILLEAAALFGLIYFFVPVGQFIKEISRLIGAAISLGIGIRISVWFYREIDQLFSKQSSTEGGQLEVDNSRSRPIEDALQTADERFDEEVSKITDRFRINESGDITLVPEDDTADDPKYLLYVVAAKVAHKLGTRDTPRVSPQELSDQVNTTFPVEPFLHKAGRFLQFHHRGDLVEKWSDVPDRSEEIAEVEVDVTQIEGAVEWIEKGSRNAPKHLSKR